MVMYIQMEGLRKIKGEVDLFGSTAADFARRRAGLGEIYGGR